eukprot:1205041-Rhodomonas_salina.1
MLIAQLVQREQDGGVSELFQRIVHGLLALRDRPRQEWTPDLGHKLNKNDTSSPDINCRR